MHGGEVATSSTGARAVATLLTLLFALVMYGAGLIAPLTPSKGAPSLIEVSLCWILPMFALGALWLWDRSIVGCATSAIVLALMFVSYAPLLWQTLS